MTSPNTRVATLISEVYRPGLNVWIFGPDADKKRIFPVGKIRSIIIRDSQTDKWKYSYASTDETPTAIIDFDHYEGESKRHRIDDVLIVEDIKSPRVIDAIQSAVDTMWKCTRIEATTALELYDEAPED